MKVLHLTDLHINEPNGNKEALRANFFDEFLHSLIIQLIGSEVKAIIVTGDLINISKTENYPHVEKVLMYIADNIGVDKKNIYIVNGNHDVPRESGNLEAFNNLLGEFGTSILEKGYYLEEFDSEYSVLGLNSTGSNYSNGLPATLKDSLKSEIVSKIKDNKIKNLIVLSHHLPMSHQAGKQAPFDEDDENDRAPDRKGWAESHIWNEGGHLLRRLANPVTTSGNVFWFGGDIHRPEFIYESEKKYVIATGSLNTYPENNSSISPQARLIDLAQPKESKHFEYKFDGHFKKQLEGKWIEVPFEITNINTQHNTKIRDSINESQFTSRNQSDQATIPKTTNDLTTKPSKYMKIDDKLDALIYRTIKDHGLYQTGQFETCEEYTALSWVNIKDLLKRTELYSMLINNFKAQIKLAQEKEIDKSDIILIGADTWGAIMAARLGSASNIRNCCVAVRGESIRYDEEEVVNKRLTNIIKTKKLVIVISDVLATGKTLSTISNSLKTESSKWVAFSIICDPSYARESNTRNYENIFVACTSIKMPFIETTKLPDASMLNRDISFVSR
ncbi:metallophosphoesterase [Pseudoalteromonas sp. DY56-GL79]|uniref:metallophosphoesterase n=1 Tax=Pseudoalteromonas sp. DY56-GL79 TaxID=2967131 RepID=UPI00352A9370